MTDKTWLLSPKAIAAARKCISIIESEEGIKLKLAQPDFLEQLTKQAQDQRSSELEKALALLAQYAPATIQVNMTTARPRNITSETTNEAFVLYHGKHYPRYQDGGEFQGLYRGQPRYA